MDKKLKESQAKLNSLEKKLVENSKTRQSLQKDAEELRDEYIKEQNTREALLRDVLTTKENE